MIEMILQVSLNPLPLMLAGALAHLLANVARERANGKMTTLRSYIQSRPYSSVLNVLGALIAVLILYDSGQLTPLAAVTIGYTGDSVLKNLIEPAGHRIANKVGMNGDL